MLIPLDPDMVADSRPCPSACLASGLMRLVLAFSKIAGLFSHASQTRGLYGPAGAFEQDVAFSSTELRKRAILQPSGSGQTFKGLDVAQRYCASGLIGDRFVQRWPDSPGPPFFPRKQPFPSDRTGAVQGAERGEAEGCQRRQQA